MGGPVANPDLAGFALGTLTIFNDTPDFPAQQITYSLDQAGPAVIDGIAAGIDYISETTCAELGPDPFIFRPFFGDSGSPRWGPAPIVILIADYRNPDFPDGDPSRLPVLTFQAADSLGAVSNPPSQEVRLIQAPPTL